MNKNQTTLPLIPYPQQINFLPGSFQWTSKTLISINSNLKEITLFLDSLPDPIRPSITNEEKDSQLKIIIDPFMRNEAYHLSILPDHLELIAAGAHGIFYALQTLLQLILAEHKPEMQLITLPCLQIIDSPRFAWRGLMLDEARHFQGIQTVKDLLDWMACFKLNVFHWHLTEDQGWRIEIKRYPRLIEVGASRSASQISGFLGKKLNAIPHTGFYTQEEIREIVQYAAERHIQIVPEIEMPGHSQAALAAYPALGCTGGPYQVSPHWGIHSDILCPGKPGTTTFLQNVLTEVLELFPGKYIHTGGDEAPKTRWKSCPDCQKLAKESNVTRINDLQTILTNRISNFLNIHGRTLIGWNEMLAEGLDPEAVVQYWVGKEKTLLKHIRSGRKAILSNFSAYYLDHSYEHSPLDKVYQYEPVFSQLESSLYANILGIEAPLWTEFVPNRARLDWQIFPRLLAVAETAWLDPGKKDLTSFHQRLPGLLKQLDAKNIGYALLSDANPPVYQRLSGPLSLVQAGKGQREG
ncbi:MAG: beta-N-acetylhexosaminidase [Anaerolineaceae bacterium]|nr:beta-N-acetylhexosaminidase [Anaerolineaceae bacterium]